MSKIILFDKDAREKLFTGVNVLTNAVKATLGPRGRNVVIEQPYKPPHITKDGVTVAKEVYLDDPVENMGADMVRQAASTTANMAGDGTTTSTVLAQYMISEGLSNVEKGANPNNVKKGMQRALKDVITLISERSESIDIDSDRLKQVATISANNDEFLGNMIAEAIQAVGEQGIVAVDESKTAETSVSVLKGINFDKGYLSPNFVTDTEKMTAEFNDPLFLFVDENIRDIQRLVPIIEACNIPEVNRALVVVADDIIEQALNSLAMNKMQKGLRIVAIKAPSYGDNRKDTMKDMATATGGKYISASEGIDLDTLSKSSAQNILAHLGEADKVIVRKNETIIIGAKGEGEEVDLRVGMIKAELAETKIPEYKRQMQERIAKLTGGVAVVHVGAATEMEMKEKKDRVDDSVAATQAALEEGIIPGGGYLLANISSDLCDKCFNDEQKGYNIVTSSLIEPMRVIMANAGYTEDETIEMITKSIEEGVGFDALNDLWVDLKEEGIIDPAKVTRVALENAVSVACTLLTTNVTINMNPEDKPKDVSNQFGPMMGY